MSSCRTPKPEKYLDVAVLNSTLLSGFAHRGFSEQLKNPPVIMKGGENIVMTRQELIAEKIRFSKKMLANISQMTKTSEARDILTTSTDMYQFVIEVCESDYMLLAKLYDEGASQEKITTLDWAIKNKHASMFELHYENLMRSGKLFADKHNIKIHRII